MHTAKQGETVPASFVVINDETMQPLDLTGQSVSAARARPQKKSTSPGYTLPAYVQQAEQGRVAVDLSTLPAGDYNLEIRIDGPDGERFAPSGKYAPVRILERL